MNVVDRAVSSARTTSSETIVLTLPADPAFAAVARIVVGGLAARLDLTYEALDDLQLAVESVLAERAIASGGERTVEVEVGGGVFTVTIGPVEPEAVGTALDPRSAAPGLGAVLAAVVEDVEVVQRDGSSCIRFVKRGAPGPGAAGP